VTAGIEATTRVYNAVYPTLKSRDKSGMSPISVANAIGTAVAAARLRRLDASRHQEALAIAAALAGWCPSEAMGARELCEANTVRRLACQHRAARGAVRGSRADRAAAHPREPGWLDGHSRGKPERRRARRSGLGTCPATVQAARLLRL
jgi:hypothetical protein